MFASPVGYGCIRMKEMIGLLKEIQYEGALTIEHFGSRDHLYYMEQSAKWLTSMIK
jgi:sugar phosphate isomerase/epimerase